MFTALMLLAAMVTTDAAQSQPAAPDTSGDSAEIVVEANRNRNREIRTFVNALTPSRAGGQLSRFDGSVCPAVTGLSGVQNERVETRMRDVAKAAGIKTGPAKCMPNALVIVVENKQQFMEALERKYPAYFADAVGLTAPIPKEDGPAIAWHVESLLDSNGIKPRIMKTVDGGLYFVVDSYDSSRVKPAARPHFVAGTLVVERGALRGLTTTQLADYAAMRLFIRTKPERLKQGSAPSILNIIDTEMGASVPLTMTAWDFATLKSLYATDPMQFAAQQRVAIVSNVRKELNQGDRPGN